MGIDTPESRTRDLTEKRYGLGAKHRLTEILEAQGNTFKLKSHGTGKFGRVLGELFVDAFDVSVNKQMIAEGHAVKYFGGSKDDVKAALTSARSLSKIYVEKHIESLD